MFHKRNAREGSRHTVQPRWLISTLRPPVGTHMDIQTPLSWNQNDHHDMWQKGRTRMGWLWANPERWSSSSLAAIQKQGDSQARLVLTFSPKEFQRTATSLISDVTWPSALSPDVSCSTAPAWGRKVPSLRAETSRPAPGTATKDLAPKTQAYSGVSPRDSSSALASLPCRSNPGKCCGPCLNSACSIWCLDPVTASLSL